MGLEYGRIVENAYRMDNNYNVATHRSYLASKLSKQVRAPEHFIFNRHPNRPYQRSTGYLSIWAAFASEFLGLKHESRILRHSSNPVCCFFMIEQVRLCAVWFAENWLGSSLNQIQVWTTVQESFSRALEHGPLLCLTSFRWIHYPAAEAAVR